MAGQGARRANLRDVTVFWRGVNDGKSVMVEAQANALTVTNEQFVYVVDAGV